MRIDILTLFPGMFKGPFDESIIKRAQDKSLAQITIHNLRKWAIDKRGAVDEKPYGGGVGMLLRPEPIFNAVEDIKQSVLSSQNSTQKKLNTQNRNLKTVLLDAGGKKFNQKIAQKYSTLDQLILICGHYEGVDYRVHEHLADDVVSIGDFVVTGGELPAMMIVDSIVRLIPGVIEKQEAVEIESFSDPKKVEFPQYTRPEIFRGYKVPDVLLSGNHKEIEKWRSEQMQKRTKKNRSDLLKLKD